MTSPTPSSRLNDPASSADERGENSKLSDKWENAAGGLAVDYMVAQSRLEAAEARNRALEEQLARLREECAGKDEALKPFGPLADAIERLCGVETPDEQIQFPPVSMHELRRARTALEGGEYGK